MAANNKLSPLLKAAKVGDVAKIRELLAAGAPIEATDMHRMTPVMLAAQAGHADAFHTLVEHGANLHALAMDQCDLLECAAEGGNPEIVKFLVETGHPLEGHWQPRSQAERRTGHLTPLLSAVINAHVEAVRLLLEAGADRNAKYDGETSLAMTEGNIKHPIGDEAVKLKPRFQEIVALLKALKSESKSTTYGTKSPVELFAANARRPAYLKLRQLLEERCGPPSLWKPVLDHGVAALEVVKYTVPGVKKQKQLDCLLDEARKAGCLLVLAEPWSAGEDAALLLFPTEDKLLVVATIGTEGANYGVQTPDVIAWLTKLNEANPFDLELCGHDLVGGRFRGAVKGAKKLAEQIIEFCPSCLDEGFDTADELAKVLKKQKSFLLRWD